MGGYITPTAAGQVASMPREEQPEALKKLLAEARLRGEKKVKVKDAMAAATSQKNGGDARPAPGKRVLMRVVKNGAEVLSDDFLRGVRFAMGDLDPKSISGLVGLMKK